VEGDSGEQVGDEVVTKLESRDRWTQNINCHIY